MGLLHDHLYAGRRDVSTSSAVGSADRMGGSVSNASCAVNLSLLSNQRIPEMETVWTSQG
jgi:hypothetical protein